MQLRAIISAREDGARIPLLRELFDAFLSRDLKRQQSQEMVMRMGQ